MIKAVIFDMDGLLIDSEPFWRQAHVKVVGQKGFILTEDDVRHMAGRGTDRVVAEWQQRFGWDAAENPQVEEQVVAQVLQQVKQKGAPLPGAVELVHRLKQQGMPMAVASSSSLELIEAVLERLQIADLIDVVRSARQEKRSKPFPDVFLAAARLLGVQSAECVVFEDSLTGVKAAKAAGMTCIAVPEHPHDPVAFQATGADRVVASLEQVDFGLISSL